MREMSKFQTGKPSASREFGDMGNQETKESRLEKILNMFDLHPHELVLVNIVDKECRDCKRLDRFLGVIANRFEEVGVVVITDEVRSRRAMKRLLKELREDDLHVVLFYRDSREVTRFRPAGDFNALEVKVKSVLLDQILPHPEERT